MQLESGKILGEPMHTMTFCIFSFNRGRFLENCVTSIEQCVENPEIVIFDDDSDDAETLELLTTLGQRHQVVRPPRKGDIKHGGLYYNMQGALERLHDRALLCALQDDTQLVRPIPQSEISGLTKLFANNPDLGFIQPCFLQRRKIIAMNAAQSEQQKLLYREDHGQSAGVHYSDLHITHPARLLEKGWRFFQSEPENDRQAKALFGPMAYLHTPIAMWLPEAPAYRGKKKTWALKLAEEKRRCGFYPFELLSEQEVERLRQRPEDDLPFAESYLSCKGSEPPKPWKYSPLSGNRWLKHLNSLEVFLTKHFPKGR